MNEELRRLVEKMESGRQFRRNDLRPELRALGEDDDDNEEYIIEGHATTFDEEYPLYSFDDWNGYRVNVFEKVDRHAFDETDMTDVIFLFDHAGRVMARIRNKTLIVRPDEIGLFTRANLGTSEFGPGLWRDIRSGNVDRMSMQFTVSKWGRTEERNDDERTIKVVRTVEKIGKLYDVSAVGIPANDGTDISARRAADGVIAELEAERLNAQKRMKSLMALKLKLDLSLER